MYSLAEGAQGYKPGKLYSLYGGVEEEAIRRTPDLREVVPPVAVPLVMAAVIVTLIATHLPGIFHSKPGVQGGSTSSGQTGATGNVVLHAKPNAKNSNASSLANRLKAPNNASVSRTAGGVNGGSLSGILSPAVVTGGMGSGPIGGSTSVSSPGGPVSANGSAGGPSGGTVSGGSGGTGVTSSVSPTPSSPGVSAGVSATAPSSTGPLLQANLSGGAGGVSAGASATVPVTNQTISVDPAL